MLDKISLKTLKQTISYDIFIMALHFQLANSLMDFEYGLEQKISMFDEQSEEFAVFSSDLPYEKSISEWQL